MTRICIPTALALLVCSSSAASAAPPAPPITGGADTDGDPAVVALIDAGGIRCTGTLIAPHLVLTAAHCFHGASWLVHFGPDPDQATTKRVITRWIVHPGWNPATLAYDVALVVLDKAAPAEIAPAVIARRPPVGWGPTMPLRVVGYGKRTVDDTAPAHKRQGVAAIEALGTHWFSLATGAARTCHGDSGGPAFAPDGFGGEVLVGVTSYGDTECLSLSVDQRVDAVAADFLLPYIAIDTAGTLGHGESCVTDFGCGAGLRCVSDDSERHWACGGACEVVTDCATKAESCTGDLQGGVCRDAAAWLGDFCDVTPDCGDGLCLAQDDGTRRCAAPCAPESCPSLDGRDPEPPAGDTGGCAAGGAGASGAALSAALLAGLWLLRGRRSRTRRRTRVRVRALALALQSLVPCADRSC